MMGRKNPTLRIFLRSNSINPKAVADLPLSALIDVIYRFLAMRCFLCAKKLAPMKNKVWLNCCYVVYFQYSFFSVCVLHRQVSYQPWFVVFLPGCRNEYLINMTEISDILCLLAGIGI